MLKSSVLLACCAFATTIASAQVFELGISGGVSRMGKPDLGATAPTGGVAITMTDGFRLGFRITFNTYRFFGHEVGYAYNRSKVRFGSDSTQDIATPLHQGFYDFMVYATPEGNRVRPFACGGVGFSSFFPPGSSVYYGNQVTKFGINYGGGIKVRLKGFWGLRLDLRQYNTGKPFDFPNQSGRLMQTEISGGVTINL